MKINIFHFFKTKGARKAFVNTVRDFDWERMDKVTVSQQKRPC